MSVPLSVPPFEAQVSVFHGSFDTAVQEQLPLGQVLERIRVGHYKAWITTLRDGRQAFGEKTYKEAKARSHGFTPAGAFSQRANAKLLTPTGLVHFDFDALPHLIDAKTALVADPLIAYVFISPGGTGLKLAVWADGIVDDRTYKHAWATVLGYLAHTYPAIAASNDPSCKDISRMCYVSFDAELYQNPEPRQYTVPPPPPKASRPPRPTPPPGTEESLEARARDASWSIPADDYHVWVAVGQSLHSTEEGWARSLWDTWSQTSEKYQESTQNSKWRSFNADAGRTIRTLFYLAMGYGWKPSKKEKAAWKAPQYPVAIPQMWSSVPTEDSGTPAGDPPENTGTPAPAQRPPVNPDDLLTDNLNARVLVRDHGKDFRHCLVWDSWLAWSVNHWQRDTAGAVMQFAKKTIKGMAKQITSLEDTESKLLLKHITSSLSTARLKAMLVQAQDEPGIPVEPDDFDRDPWLLNCQNGTVNLKTGERSDHRKEDLITRCLDIPYEPTAQCPNWLKFLWRIMGGSTKPDDPDMGIGVLAQRDQADDEAREMIAFLQRAIGYSLSGSTREQCLFILYGITKTGKSTFLNVLRKLLGPYGTQADMETFMHKDRPQVRNDLADLAGKRLVCAVEAQEGRRLNENLIKQLTGGTDEIKARFLFEEHFTFKPQFKVFIGTNHKPIIRDRDDAIWERIRLIPFEVQIPFGERVKDLDETLQKELPGILAWAVEGCLTWQDAKDLKPPARVTAATTGYKDEMDVVGRFLKDVCNLASTEKTLASRLLKTYQEWSGQTSLSGRAFAKLLTDKGYHSDHERTGTFWYGIGLPPEEEPEETKPEGGQSQQALPGV